MGTDRCDWEPAIHEGVDPDGWTRRDFLKETGLGAVALSLGAAGCSNPPEQSDAQGAADQCERVIGRKPKIAIIGGGPAALSAAFHLTAEENWQDRYEVTVYQIGWRLGGKGATGRNTDEGCGWRIEEHGIHGFCRFYFNTWRMMKQVYGELASKYPDALEQLPAKKIADAFLPSSVTYPVEYNKTWYAKTDYFPVNDGSPWDDDSDLKLTFLAVMKGLLRAALLRGRRDFGPFVPEGNTSAAFAGVLIEETLVELYEVVSKLEENDPEIELEKARFVPVLDGWIKKLQALEHERKAMTFTVEPSDRNRFLTLVDFYLALLLGLTTERRSAGNTFELDHLDGIDYRDWLEKYGASLKTLTSAITYSVANILFAYRDGDSTNPPELSTASWLSWVARSVLGHGEYFYFLLAGTGETVVLPLYLLLQKRGVKFQFFHKLVGVKSIDDQQSEERIVEQLRFEQQARLKQEDGEYHPLLTLPRRHYSVWPNRPIWEQIAEPGEKRDLDFEDWETDESNPAPVWMANRGSDFDYVVWAIPPSMIPLVGDEGMKQVWSEIQELPTTATQAAQVWLTKDTNELGWPRKDLKPETARYASASFPNPLNGCVAFDDLIKQEAWPSGGPKGLIYLCSQLHVLSTNQTRRDSTIRVRSTASSSLRSMGNFLTKGRAGYPDRVDEQSLDFDLLYDPTSTNKGEERLEFQYVRANTRPTEAYVQAPRGLLKGRFDTWDSRFTNLVIAGDWVRTGFNLGSFESAVTGGKLAAFALAGIPNIRSVVAYDFLHATAEARIKRALDRGPRIPSG